MGLIGNDFFVVRYLGIDKTKVSDPLIVYWDSGNNQFQATTTIPKVVSDILYHKEKFGGPISGGCSLEGQAFPEDWEYCIGGTVFKCDGSGYWVNQNRSC